MFIHSALASTPISGAINQNTTWTLTGSPYVLSGSVTVTNGAQLTVEAGVQIQMEVDAELRIVNGSLAAQGTASNPIVFTSIHDVAGSSTPPAKGDWNALVFENGTVDANTVLTHVEIYYGHGVVIQSASPTFHFVHLEHNAGAAITVDLKSSPVGSDLTAIDNDVNGIVVPSGEIENDVHFKMRGIPYVIQQGLVTVGKRFFTLSPSYLKLAQGATATFDLEIPDPAPAGGLVVNTVSSVPSVASVPTTVTLPENTQIASLSVNALTLGTSTITASQTGYGTATAKVDVVLPPSILLSPQSALVGVGKSLFLTLTLSDIAPAGGTTVALTAVDPSMFSFPAQVVIPAGQKVLTFPLQGLSLGTTTLTANAVGFGSSIANVTVRSVSLDLPPSVLVAPNSSQIITLSLTDPAPAGDLVVDLNTGDSGIATVPATVTVPAGNSAITFAVTGVAQGTTTLSATVSGYEAANSTITVDTIAIQFNPATAISVPQGLTQTRQVKLNKTAPPGGVTINLSTANSSLLSVTPATVTVPAGQTAATEIITITGLAQGTTQLIGQGTGLTTGTLSAQITMPVSLNFNKTTVAVGKGLTTKTGGYNELSISLKSGTSPYTTPTPVTIALSSTDPAKVTVPTTVTIAAGSQIAYFGVTGTDLTPSAIAVNASATGYTPPAQPLAVNVVTPALIFSGLNGNRSTVSPRDDFSVYWDVAGAQYRDQRASSQQALDLAIVAANPTDIVSGFHDALTAGNVVSQISIAAGSNGSGTRFVGVPTAPGTYQIQASLQGVGTWTSAVQTVVNPELRFNRTSAIVGKSLKTSGSSWGNMMSVAVYANGQLTTVTSPVTVTLTSGDPSKVATSSSTVTIAAGASTAAFDLIGVDLTGSDVTVNASATGYTSSVQPVSVTVVTPELRFSNLANSRHTASPRDDFQVHWFVPGLSSPYYSQSAAATQTIDLSVVNDTPSGIVPGFHDTASNGNSVTQATIAAGSNSSSTRFVDTPTAAGTYQVQAQLANVSTGTSVVQTVVATNPELKFNRTYAAVGKSLNTQSGYVSISLVDNGNTITTPTPLVITLTSSDTSKVTVPATVTIPAGQSAVNFLVTGVELGASAATINASAAGYASPAQLLSVGVVTPTLHINSLEGKRSTTGMRDEFSVNWYVAEAAYPYYYQTATTTQTLDISIAEENPVGIVPGFHDALTAGNAITQVTIPAGANNSNSNYRYVDTPALTGTYKVQVALSGVGSWLSGQQTVYAPALVFSRNPVNVGYGLTNHANEVSIVQQAGGQTFNGVAPVTINLSCVATAVCDVPATVTIPAGQSSVPVIIKGMGLGSTQIVASAVGYTPPPNLDVNVIAPEIRFNSWSSTLGVGQSDNFTVFFYVTGAGLPSSQIAINPTTINLASAAPGVATVPATVTISAGQNSSPNITLTGVAPGTTTVTASGVNLTTSTSPTVTVQ